METEMTDIAIIYLLDYHKINQNSRIWKATDCHKITINKQMKHASTGKTAGQ